MMKRHFESVLHRKDGCFVLASSALSGRIWNGSLWVFTDVEEYEKCPNLDMVATRTSAGLTDAVWVCDEQSILLSSDSGELELWTCCLPGHTLQYQLSLGSHDDMALCVGCLPGGNMVVSGGADRRIIVWDLSKETRVESFKGHSDMVIALAARRSSSSCFVTTSLDGTVKVWDLREKQKAVNQIATVPSMGKVYSAVTWSHAEDHSLAIGSESGEVQVFDLRGADALSVLSFQPHSRAVRRLAYSAQEPSLLASVSDDSTVSVFSLHSSSKVLASAEHTDFVHGLSWHPSGSHLVSCGWGGQVLQHSLETNGIMAGGVAKDEDSLMS